MAARTCAIRLAANVLSLPLRLPAVVARSAASLDLLSGGRVDLGLGRRVLGRDRGDRRAAAGSRVSRSGAGRSDRDHPRHLAPGEPGVLRVDGDVYRVGGAKRGPAPAHDIGIWLGAEDEALFPSCGRQSQAWHPVIGRLADKHKIVHRC